MLALTGLLLVAIGIAPCPAVARRGRVRMSGRGLSPGAKYSGSVLTQDQLRQCLTQESQINAAIEKLDKDEAFINAQERLVDQYSQTSVDRFNRLISQFNESVATSNASIDAFNASCSGRAYYESDMKAARTSLGLN